MENLLIATIKYAIRKIIENLELDWDKFKRFCIAIFFALIFNSIAISNVALPIILFPNATLFAIIWFLFGLVFSGFTLVYSAIIILNKSTVHKWIQTGEITRNEDGSISFMIAF